MNRALTFVVLLITVVVLSVSLLLLLRDNKSLVQTKNNLILQNDSLQLLQIQSRKETAVMKVYIDSILLKR
jgi:hypothetical protein